MAWGDPYGGPGGGGVSVGGPAMGGPGVGGIGGPVGGGMTGGIGGAAVGGPAMGGPGIGGVSTGSVGGIGGAAVGGPAMGSSTGSVGGIGSLGGIGAGLGSPSLSSGIGTATGSPMGAAVGGPAMGSSFGGLGSPVGGLGSSIGAAASPSAGVSSSSFGSLGSPVGGMGSSIGAGLSSPGMGMSPGAGLSSGPVGGIGGSLGGFGSPQAAMGAAIGAGMSPSAAAAHVGTMMGGPANSGAGLGATASGSFGLGSATPFGGSVPGGASPLGPVGLGSLGGSGPGPYGGIASNTISGLNSLGRFGNMSGPLALHAGGPTPIGGLGPQVGAGLSSPGLPASVSPGLSQNMMGMMSGAGAPAIGNRPQMPSANAATGAANYGGGPTRTTPGWASGSANAARPGQTGYQSYGMPNLSSSSFQSPQDIGNAAIMASTGLSNPSQASLPQQTLAADQAYGFPEGTMGKLVNYESAKSWSPSQRNPFSRAAGLTQMTPGTMKAMGVTDPTNPTQQIFGGAKYLGQQVDQFGSVPAGLGAYYAGPGNFAKQGTSFKGNYPGAPTAGQYASSVLGQNPSTNPNYARLAGAQQVGPSQTLSPVGSTGTAVSGVGSPTQASKVGPTQIAQAGSGLNLSPLSAAGQLPAVGGLAMGAAPPTQMKTSTISPTQPAPAPTGILAGLQNLGTRLASNVPSLSGMFSPSPTAMQPSAAPPTAGVLGTPQSINQVMRQAELANPAPPATAPLAPGPSAINRTPFSPNTAPIGPPATTSPISPDLTRVQNIPSPSMTGGLTTSLPATQPPATQATGPSWASPVKPVGPTPTTGVDQSGVVGIREMYNSALRTPFTQGSAPKPTGPISVGAGQGVGAGVPAVGGIMGALASSEGGRPGGGGSNERWFSGYAPHGTASAGYVTGGGSSDSGGGDSTPWNGGHPMRDHNGTAWEGGGGNDPGHRHIGGGGSEGNERGGQPLFASGTHPFTNYSGMTPQQLEALLNKSRDIGHGYMQAKKTGLTWQQGQPFYNANGRWSYYAPGAMG